MRKQIADFILNRDRFAVTAHARPDGDAIGSELALALALRALGKTVDIGNADPIPRIYRFLPGAESIRIVDEIDHRCDAVIILECSDYERTGLNGLERHFTINIDHHPATTDFADLNWVDPTSAAVGLMIMRLLKDLQAPITPEVATNLYVAALTDTGSFQHNISNADIFRDMAELTALGADPTAIAQRIYRTQSVPRLRLLEAALRTLELDLDGRIAWIRVCREDLEATGALAEDSEGFVNYPISLKGVQAAAFFREDSPDCHRVSLRSKGRCDVGSLARRMGGGGHRNAAGMTIRGAWEQTLSAVLKGLEEIAGDETHDPGAG